jgi:nucleotide-binding universal stress UspA family protein
MSFVVPFDGSELAETALGRAVEYGVTFEEPVTVVSVVPERTRYAREKGWIGDEEPLNVDHVVSTLRSRVRELAPEATFEYERIHEFPPEDRIADHIERVALRHDPSVLFLGSDNVGRVVTPLASVGVHLADEEDYDIYLVRHPAPPTGEK